MTRPKPAASISKRDAILDAMLDVVVERGFHEAPMSLVSKRSGASAGVIYHYFASKEEIIQAIYQRVRALKHASFFKGYSEDLDPREAMITLWINAYKFYRRHLRELRFLDQFDSAGFTCAPEKSLPPDPQQKEFQRSFRSRARGGVLNNLPPQVLEEMTLGLAQRLAKQPRRLSGKVLRNIAENLWEAVRAAD